MPTYRTPPPAAFFPAAILLTLVGWGGRTYISNYLLPTLLPRWLYFFFIVLVYTGVALPIAAFLNHRFPSTPPVTSNVILRQALWVSIFSSTIIWLKYGRVYSFTLAVILFLGMSTVEFLLRMRERSLWKPK